MIGTRLAYYLNVRWKSGARDTFEITKDTYKYIKERTTDYAPWNDKVRGIEDSFQWTTLLKCKWNCPTPSGLNIVFNGAEICWLKLVTKTVSSNPLEHPTRYENPLN